MLNFYKVIIKRLRLQLLVVALLMLPGLTLAQAAGLPGVLPPQSGPATSAEPAKPAPTIIPGSPLAALTGATPAPKPVDDHEARAPFGTQAIGFALNTALGRGTLQTANGFIVALERSTRLAPVIQWAHNFMGSPWRQADALAILKGFGIVIVPGLLLDIVIGWVLRRFARVCDKKARPNDQDYLCVAGPNGLQPSYPLRLTLRGWLRRVRYALLRFFLMLVPLAAFVVFVLLVLSSDFISNRAAHLAITAVTNAYICVRLIQDVMRLLIAPHWPNLRLIRIPTPYACWTMRRVTILLFTIGISFCLISVVEILGLSDAGGMVLIRLAGLVVHLELAVWVWQCRKVVSRWIAGGTESKSIFAGLRRRFAKVWYIFALLYLIGLWVAWAGGVQNALGVILRAILVVFTVLVLARLTWIGFNRLLKRIFPDEETEVTSELAVFHKRFRGYMPLVRLVVRGFILILTVVLVLQGWGVDAFSWVLTNPIGRALFSTLANVLVTIAGAILVWEICTYLLEQQINRLGNTRQATRLRTLSPMLRAAMAVIVVMLALIVGLSRIGVNTTGLLAVSSVVGIAVGFGSQKLVQDVITGLFLLFEDAMQVGDSVTLGGMSGTVERLSIRTIRLRGSDGSVNIIPFSSVTTVTNQTRDFSFAQISIMVGYHENIDRVVDLLKKIGAQMRDDPAWSLMIRDDVQIFGLDAFDELGLVITGQIRTGPGQHASVRREYQARVQKCFLEEGIELPYRHQTFQLEVPPGRTEIINAPQASSNIVGNKNPPG